MQDIESILNAVKNESISVNDAVGMLEKGSFADIGFAKVDISRKSRQGVSEVIYGSGKTAEQIISITDKLVESGQNNILITRTDTKKAELLKKTYSDIFYDEISQCAVLGGFKEPDGIGTILIAAAGTSDLPIAEEAAVTAMYLGNKVERIYDVGVAGIHRLLSYTDSIMNASVIIAAAGMEGALPSVIGGLADCPVIALPTSVGYGASLGGISALLSMLNSCASGITVVNIDNGFGAGFAASRINHMKPKT